MKKSISFKYPHIGTVINLTHVGHHKDLYLGFLLPSVTNQYPAEPIDVLEEELSKTYLQWATDEVLKVGYISLYHLWEKQIVNLLKYQLAASGERYKDPKKSVSLVNHVKTLLKDHFDIDTEIEPRLWSLIDEARTVTNTCKHATAVSYQKLLSNCPEYFTKGVYNSKTGEESSFFRITHEKFRSICEAIEEFWEKFPHEVDYSDCLNPV